MYKLVNCWLNPNLLEAKQVYSPSSASVTDSKTRGLEYTFAGPSSIRPDFRAVKSWPFKSNALGGLYNALSTFLNHCGDIRKRKTKFFRHSPIITKIFLKDKQLHSMNGTSFFGIIRYFTRYNDMAWFDKKVYMWLWVYYAKFRYSNTRVAKGLKIRPRVILLRKKQWYFR